MSTHRLVLRTPAQAVVGEPIWALLTAKRANGRTDFEYSGTVEFSCTDEGADLPGPTTVFACERGRHLFSVTFHRPGEHRLRVRDTDNWLEAESAPIVVTEAPSELNLYWGDLHGHTGEYSCGYGTIDNYYTYARDYAGLDFCALTEHDHLPGHPRDLSTIWERVKRAARYYNDPHRFVTFLGYEWTSMFRQKPDDERAFFGQRHVLYLSDDQPWFGCHRPQSDTPEKLWSCLEGREALVILHHTAASTQWGFGWEMWNPDLERLVEIYSVWGSSERPEREGNPYPIRAHGGENDCGHVQRAFEKGYRLGICAGGDSHDGSPGDTWAWGKYTLGKGERKRWGEVPYHGGLHGVWAKELTREALWEALLARRCFGTTGARIRVEFFVEGRWMGSELSVPPDAPRRLRVRVLGTAPLKSVELVKNNEDWRSLPCQGHRCEAEVVDDEPVGDRGFYYVRVTQADGEMAWSSPVWVVRGGG